MSTLLEQIEAFCGEHGLSDSLFGIQAVNDKNLVRDLRDNRDVRLSTAEKIRSFMREFRPSDQSEAA